MVEQWRYSASYQGKGNTGAEGSQCSNQHRDLMGNRNQGYLGKLPDPGSTEALVRRSGYFLGELTLEHVETVKRLPLHHRDPFDRMLIAQSLVDDATLISNETIFDAYGVKRLWA